MRTDISSNSSSVVLAITNFFIIWVFVCNAMKSRARWKSLWRRWVNVVQNDSMIMLCSSYNYIGIVIAMYGSTTFANWNKPIPPFRRSNEVFIITFDDSIKLSHLESISLRMGSSALTSSDNLLQNLHQMTLVCARFNFGCIGFHGKLSFYLWFFRTIEACS